MTVTEDRERSPHTGWTRVHWEEAADALLDGVAAHASRRGAFYHPPGGRPSMWGADSDGLEGYARTFLLAAFRIAGARGEGTETLALRYAEGLAAGTDPSSGETWPEITDGGQPMVEAASVAIGLFETRPWLWDSLDDGVRQRAVDWLSGFHGKRPHPNNWLLFNVVVNAFLKSVGAPYRSDEIDRHLDAVDAMYRRDGWYTDGAGRNYDHYVGWALHLYTNLWARMDPSEPGRATVYRERLRRFLSDFRLLFAADGAPLHQGRSLIYRFAAAASLWMGALAEATPLAPGETRRLASGCLRHFLDRGAVRDGVLSMGWYGEHLPMAQVYSGPSSPYWASKGFLGLLLPPDHEVWTATEQPSAAEGPDAVTALAEPGWLVSSTRDDGIVRVANHGSDRWPWMLRAQPDPNYRKLAYATHAAPETGEDGDAADVDSQFVLLGPDDGHSWRARILPLGCVDVFAASFHFPGESDPSAAPSWQERVETVTIARGPAQIRVHHVLSPQMRAVREGGFSIAGSDRPEHLVRTERALVRRADGLWSGVWSLHGFDGADVVAFEDSNAYGRSSAAPVLTGGPMTGAEAVFVSLVVLAGEAFEPEAVRAEIDHVEVDGRLVTVTCADGTAYLVQLVAPEHVDLALSGQLVRGPVRFARVSGEEVFVHPW